MNLSTYFKERKGFERLLKKLKDKYVSLGRYSGTIELENLTASEAIELSKFFGQKLVQGQTFKTSFSKIEKRLRNTIFENFTWKELFTDYFGTHPISKVDLAEQLIKEENEFFRSIKMEISNELAAFISNIIENKDAIYTTMMKRYHKDTIAFKRDLLNILKIIDNLDTLTPSTLPLIASSTGDPHFLDMNTQNNSLFIKLLARYKNLIEPTTNQEKINFLMEFGIGIDDLSNYAITYLLSSNTEFIESFKRADEPLNINLHNIEKIDTLFTDSNHIFVFENPSILTKLKFLKIPMIITSGNPNYVVYRLLDKLSKASVQIHYNGDFDPEGLIIANKLKNRYPNLDLFCYREEDYHNALSENYLNTSRLKKLEHVEEISLKEIKTLLLLERRCGYQENNIDSIKAYILALLNDNF